MVAGDIVHQRFQGQQTRPVALTGEHFNQLTLAVPRQAGDPTISPPRTDRVTPRTDSWPASSSAFSPLMVSFGAPNSPALEGERILRFLIDHCSKPEWTWRAHSIAFWDNRCTHHKAIWDYWPNVRSGYRIRIEGTAPPEAG
jgi:hypothetical protein